MALNGELKDFGLLQLLTLVQVTSKTGVLSLQRPGTTASIYFENGQMTRVKVANSHRRDLVADLYQAGRIGREEQNLVKSQTPPSEKAVALLLEDQGLLSREEIADFVRDRSLADLYSLLVWTEGSFRMEVGSAPSDEDIVAPADLTAFLQKGRSYIEEWQNLSAQIPDLSWNLRLLPEPLERVEEVRLSRDEWRMVVSLTGETTVETVAGRLGLDELAVRQAAHRLIEAGLAEVVAPEPAPVPARSVYAQELASLTPLETLRHGMQEEEPADEQEIPKTSAFSRLFGRR